MKPWKLSSITLSCLLLQSGICFADSTAVSIPAGKGMFPAVSVPSPAPVQNEDYPQTECPVPANLVCPDINGNIPAGTSINCPDICIVKRKVVTSGSVPIYTSDAVCPTGYATLNTYHADTEITRVPAQWGVDPIDQANYNLALQYGANCYPDGHDIWGPFMCSRQTPYDIGDIAPENQIPSPQSNTSNMVQVSGYEKSCWTLPSCDGNAYRDYYDKRGTINTSCAAARYNGQHYVYQHLTCDIPEHVGYTTNIVPTYTLCGRIKQTWTPVNQ